MLRPRLLLVLAVIAWLTTIGFTTGGTETGDQFGWYGIVRYWMVIAPILLLLLSPLVGAAWNPPLLRATWRLANASPVHMALDRYRNFCAVFLVYAGALLMCCAFLVARIERSPLWLATLVILTVAGPLAGGYLFLGLGYAAEMLTGSAAVRVGLIALAAPVELAGQAPWPALTVSGFTLGDSGVPQWPMSFLEQDLTNVPTPSASYVGVRALALLVATGAVLVAHRSPTPDGRSRTPIRG
jgi:hypothetical protein